MSYLEHIKNGDDIRKLSFDELNVLAEEIRMELIRTVSHTGGHLASNLGAVEITIAIHNIFNSEKDRILFDVGHQSYVHKLLTGRMDRFDSLRSLNGLSGFPKPRESVSDAFTAGHASTAVSTALGMARARTLKGEDYSVIAVVGDGAASGGVFFEGMNDAGASKEPLIVILNDNEMSISPSVGGLAKHLSGIRLKPGYFSLKKGWRNFTKIIPGGKTLYHATHKLKDWLHRGLIGYTIFEKMGFVYLGPVDGHDIRKLSYLLARAKEEQCPVLIHAITKKGKGYLPAEMNPDAFHGVGPFNPETGETLKKSNNFSGIFGDTMLSLAEKDKRICAVCAGMISGTGLRRFSEKYPERCFDVGIAEEHAVSMCGGLAAQGMIPVFAVYSTFLQRSFDMLMQDVALQQLHVVLGIDRAGIVGEDGETHQGIYDVGMLRAVPGMRIFAPCCYQELNSMLRYAVCCCNGPVAVRYPRGSEGSYRTDKEYSGQCEDVLVHGVDVTLVSYGRNINDVLCAADAAQDIGITADVVRLLEIHAVDYPALFDSVSKTKRLVVVEEQNLSGSIGELLSEMLLNKHIDCSAILLNTGNGFTTHGTPDQLRKQAGLDADGILHAIKEITGNEK